MADETTQEKKPADKAVKKEKAPALEDKPFTEFIQQDFLSTLQKAIEKQGIENLQLDFAKQPIAITGLKGGDCWQISGTWAAGKRNFNLYFPDEDIQGKKFFSCHEGNKPSVLEHFLGDERKITLDLMLFGIVQRLNGQKWLARN